MVNIHWQILLCRMWLATLTGRVRPSDFFYLQSFRHRLMGTVDPTEAARISYRVFHELGEVE